MKTRVIIQVQVPASDAIYLRGEGIPQLTWEKGLVLKQDKPDEWIFETEEPFAWGEFRILVNDRVYELGGSHSLYPGLSVRINPKFLDSES